MRKLIYLVASTLLFTLYLIYSYNEHSGRSYIYEPVYITLNGDIPENVSLDLIYQTINDPTAVQHASLLFDDSIPDNTYIFEIDSSYRLTNFSIYFKSLSEGERFTLTQIKASNSRSGEFSFSLKEKDLMATNNLKLEPVIADAVSISKIETETAASSALSFSMRASFYGVFVKTNIRIPEIPSTISLVLIALLGALLMFSLYPMITNLKWYNISKGAYPLALAVLLLPTGEKVCNFLLAISILAGAVSHLKDGSFKVWIKKNRRILILVGIILLIYAFAILFSDRNASSSSLFTVKLGLPLALVAVAINTNNKPELRLQYAALLTGVIISVFIHFGWAIMLVDSVEIKTKLLSNPRHYVESSVFSRIHHSYLSVIYLAALTIIYFQKDLLPLLKKERIIFAILILIALLSAFSRAAVLSLASILLYLAFKSLFNLLKIEITQVVRYLTASALTIGLLAIILFDFNIDWSTDANSVKGYQTRITLWENASEIIKQKPLTGWGPENYKQALIQSRSQNSVNSNTWRNLNTHNQFLETSGMFGLIVGIGLMWFLLFPTGFSRQHTWYMEYIFIVALIFLIGFLFESFLTRNLGILIFGLCYGLLLKTNPDHNE